MSVGRREKKRVGVQRDGKKGGREPQPKELLLSCPPQYGVKLPTEVPWEVCPSPLSSNDLGSVCFSPPWTSPDISRLPHPPRAQVLTVVRDHFKTQIRSFVLSSVQQLLQPARCPNDHNSAAPDRAACEDGRNLAKCRTLNLKAAPSLRYPAGAVFLTLGVVCVHVDLWHIRFTFRKESLCYLSLTYPIRGKSLSFIISESSELLWHDFFISAKLNCTQLLVAQRPYNHSHSFALNPFSFLLFFPHHHSYFCNWCILPGPAKVVPFLWSLPCSTSGRIVASFSFPRVTL